MSNNPAKYEVLIKQYLLSILDISAEIHSSHDHEIGHHVIFFSVNKTNSAYNGPEKSHLNRGLESIATCHWNDLFHFTGVKPIPSNLTNGYLSSYPSRTVQNEFRLPLSRSQLSAVSSQKVDSSALFASSIRNQTGRCGGQSLLYHERDSWYYWTGWTNTSCSW